MDAEQHERFDAKAARAAAVADGKGARKGLAAAIDALDDLTDARGLTGDEREATRKALGLALAAMTALNEGAPVLTGLQPPAVAQQ